MKKFIGDEIRTFLRALDKHVSGAISFTVIGGAAASLAFQATSGTMDIDTSTNVGDLEEACERARKETGLAIPFGQSTVFEAPYEYESRLKSVDFPGLKNLKIHVPEKHDWAFMKIARLLDKDKQAIKEVSERVGFDKDVFLRRFQSEMTHIEPANDLRFYFLTMMEELYGKKEADRMEHTLTT